MEMMLTCTGHKSIDRRKVEAPWLGLHLLPIDWGLLLY
jgi:hypothetical protein